MTTASFWGYLYLALGIIGEVCATTALKATEEFTKPLPSLICLAGYAMGLFFLSLTLRTIPVGIAYSVWGGVGTGLIALLGFILYGQRLDAPALIGMGLIVTGVAILSFSSSTVSH
jgi:small multidrug resistance pump